MELIDIATVLAGIGLLAWSLVLLVRAYQACRVRFTIHWLLGLTILLSAFLFAYMAVLFAGVGGQLELPGLVCQVMLWAAVFAFVYSWAFASTTTQTVDVLEANQTLLRRLQASADGLGLRVKQSNTEVEQANARLRAEIKERERLEEQRFEARLQHTQKLESLGVLAGGIAHDFNNLLVGMLGNAGLALLDLDEDSPARPTVEQIEIAARRAAELTQQLLAYSGKGRFVVGPVHLSSLVGEMLDLLEVSISKKAALRCDFDGSLPMIQADASQLRQVIMNLITNASDALEQEEGLITLRTGSQPVDRALLADAWASEHLPEGRYAFVEVRDTGKGMDAAVRERMFDPFFTTKSTGRGLGLASLLGIVRAHKGLIQVHSEVGSGTMIKVLLPIAGETFADLVPTVPELLSWQGGGTVLVADDEEVVRRMVERTLTRSGFDVISTVDGRDCLERFAEQPGKFDLVLLDLTMPRLNGEETFRELRRLRRDVPVLIASGYTEQETNQLADSYLASFLQKPFGPNALLAKVRSLLDLSISSEELREA